MSIQKTTLRPGLLVALKTSTRGNVTYRKQVVEAEHEDEAGVARAKWETERTVVDPKEHEAAGKARSKCRSIITAVCAQSAFGLLCPEIDAERLDKAVADARKCAEAFNDKARLTRVDVYVITGRIATDDVEAVKAINSEVRGLFADMEAGLAKLDVKAVRDAANRAKELGAMLSVDASARVQIAVDAARAACKKIVAATEQGAADVDAATIRRITEQRTAFLDLDGSPGEAEFVEAQARAIDLTPSVIPAVAPVAPAIELE